MVASSYLMPAGETLYVVRVARGLDPLKRPARPAKHTRQTYIHEAFPLPLYQTRKGVICFAPFQQCDFDSLSRDQSIATKSLTRPRTAASGRKHAVRYLDAKNDNSSLGAGEGRPLRYHRRAFRQPPR